MLLYHDFKFLIFLIFLKKEELKSFLKKTCNSQSNWKLKPVEILTYELTIFRVRGKRIQPNDNFQKFLVWCKILGWTVESRYIFKKRFLLLT